MNITANHEIKIAKALAASKAGSFPRTADDMLALLPESLIAEAPARIIAEVLDAMHACASNTKALRDAEIIEDGAVWSEDQQRSIELAA